jgi:transcriptional regulator with XRE-family HTH domain
MDRSLGRVVRALRLRLGWRQLDLARRAGVSARAISKLERQGPAGFTVRTLRKICEPLDVDLQVYGRWRGGELDRLLDAAHAALQAQFTRLLDAAGWLIRIEVTFSRYGERGSIDVLAFHPAAETLLVVEIKTVIADVQGLLRPLDAKVRLARDIAADLDWNARRVVACLVVAEESTARRRVADHEPLFQRFAVRGWAARGWLRQPEGTPSGLLLFVKSSGGTRNASSRAGVQRVRRSAA